MLKPKLEEEGGGGGELRNGDVGRDPVVIFSDNDLCSRKFLVNTTWVTGQESHFFSTSATTALVPANSIFCPDACKIPLSRFLPLASPSLSFDATKWPDCLFLSVIFQMCHSLVWNYSTAHHLDQGFLPLPACEYHLGRFKRPWWPDTTSEILVRLFCRGRRFPGGKKKKTTPSQTWISSQQ